MPEQPVDDQPIEQPSGPVETDGPGHVVIITLTPSVTTVTGPTTVSWGVTVPDGSEPSISLSFYEPVPSPVTGLTEFRDIVVSPTPTVSWSNGVGSFSVVMDSDIFDQLLSRQTSFAVKAVIPNVESHGMSRVDIDLPEA